LRGTRFQENAFCAIIEEAFMPLSAEQEALCECLEKGESTPTAATLIRHQARDIDDLWDRLSRAYALVRQESPAEMIQDEMEALRAMLAARQHSQLKKTG
jgi:Flp pilus assembly protein TadD